MLSTASPPEICGVRHGEKNEKIVAIFAFFCLLPWGATAHGLACYVSTPITPPVQYLWVLLVYAVVFVVVNALIRRRALRISGFRSVLVSVGLLACFGASFFIIGSFVATMNTAPPPGLGIPSPVLWGLTWKRAGVEFVSWNLFGLLILTVWCLEFSKPWRRVNRRWPMILINLALYCLCIMPYVVSGAWLHGWAGSYVRMGCDARIHELKKALLRYAGEHDMLPAADGIDILLPQLKGYLKADYLYPDKTPIDVCPLGRAYERDPKHYNWDTNFSGVRLQNIDNDLFWAKGKVISCPYHESMRSRTISAVEIGL